MLILALAVAGHFAFLAYLVAGGFVALRWPRSIWLHLAAVLWGACSVVIGLPCPLTWVERWARADLGLAPLPPEGFIEHYLTGVLYPNDAVGLVQALVFATVVASWLLVSAITRVGAPATRG
ncbi:DUF2784 domain-containing protein [Mycolicibacterium murale]|uniref:Protein of Uncharacterized function (DUF2784) n=2 Tax=Mycolicibacterium TaxID=1866885 RepID=A0A378TMU1_9MYCO|nr:hypothetical protein MTOK_54570 [Mycolicibacterium tokaiense]GFG58962.1 hypothetical protein MMUR_30980 [Mycolicibacterium murale]STZ61940.1 Protein of Uncharacterised function (DUF2784) [Mycolicibacterium tokaiense]